MGKKKELKKLKKRLKTSESDLSSYQSKADKQFQQLESLLSDFNEKLTDILTIRKRSENGVAHKKAVKKKP